MYIKIVQEYGECEQRTWKMWRHWISYLPLCLILQSQIPETSGEVWSKANVPSVKGDQVREHLKELGGHMGHAGMHPRVLRELADVITRSLPIIFETSWRLEEIPEAMKEITFIPIFKRSKKKVSENYSLVRTTKYDLYHRRWWSQ